jgi:hypothetical protein
MDDQHVKKSGGPPEVRMLIPVWGERYIDDFVMFSLPSLLAPGNLPLLAKSCRVTVVFLTASKNVRHFQKRPLIHKVLAGHCKIEYTPIDDLIEGTTSYSVPLTLAYFRGMTETGDAMTRTYFLCYNSDFVLADGSFRSVLRHIRDERSVILAPSFRVTMETVKPALKAHLRQTDGQFAMPPREMARLAFSNIHPTVISRIVNQKLFHSYYPNQIYWRVDQHTLLARFYLIMQLCIRPERRIETINNFVDYAFLPEMCPSGDMVALTDSDEFFMMELQAQNAENNFIRSGPAKVRHVADSLSDWTTVRHRDISRFELVFHSEELPASLPAARAQLGQFMKGVEKRLVPKPVPHDKHHYWPGAVQAWLNKREIATSVSENLTVSGPAESALAVALSSEVPANDYSEKKVYFSGLRWKLCPPFLGYYVRIKRWNSLLLGLFWGLPPRVRLWHPHWLSFHQIKAWLRRHGSGSDRRVLYVTSETDFDRIFNKSPSVSKILPRDLLGGFLQKAEGNGENATVCFIHLTEGNMELARPLMDHICGNLQHVKKMLFYLDQSLDDCGSKSVLSEKSRPDLLGVKSVDCTAISALVSYLNGSFPGRARYWFKGDFFSGRIRALFLQRFLQKRFQEMFENGDAGSLLRDLAFIGKLIFYCAAMMATNLWGCLCPKPDVVPRHCGGMIAEIELGNLTDAGQHSECSS